MGASITEKWHSRAISSFMIININFKIQTLCQRNILLATLIKYSKILSTKKTGHIYPNDILQFLYLAGASFFVSSELQFLFFYQLSNKRKTILSTTKGQRPIIQINKFFIAFHPYEGCLLLWSTHFPLLSLFTFLYVLFSSARTEHNYCKEK